MNTGLLNIRIPNWIYPGFYWFLGLHVTITAYAHPIPNIPLLVSTSAEPNIEMILDDSGSMQWEIMPDDYIYSYFVFPRASGVYGGSDYTNYVSTVDNNNPYNALSRSPQVNKIYYNPAVTYRPWSKADGSLYANASLTCAPHNPADTSKGCRNLTSNNTQTAYWDSCTSLAPSYLCTTTGNNNKTFWPATYFRHNGGDIWNWNNYTKVEIKSSTASYIGEGRENRTDCVNKASATCTYAEEIQNFANWYSYYRSRVLTARAGIGRAFANQGSSLRVGFGAINKSSTVIDGANTSTLISGVRVFSGADRDNFFKNLYEHAIPAAGTPLRRALDDAGKYFSRPDDKGPWSSTPGSTGGSDLVCRQSYTILMTDGYWNGAGASTSDATNNNDGSDGSTITGPNSQSYTYTAVSPFKDNRSNTLADVAMYYWKRDLRTDLSNEVPTNFKDPAFWQHMVTFGVGLGVSGSINPDAAFAAIHSGASITWPDPSNSDSAKLDDLLHASVNSRGGFFSAQNPEQFATALTNTLNDIAKRTGSASSVAANSTAILTETRVFQAKFNSDKWSGELEAYPVSDSGVGETPNWLASEHIPAPANRKIYTTSGGNKVAFSTLTDLSSADQTALGNKQDVVDFIRGVRSKELQNGGPFRNRGTNILGDLVHSSPYYVKDTDTVYIGANDGMLHAIKVATGEELFAYIPSAVIPKFINLTKPDYLHDYFVDGDIAVSSKAQTADHNYLVGTLGHGGKGLFGLDVTSPASFGASNVLWEYFNTGDADLGYMLGQPIIAKMNDGSMAVILGNGYNSTSGKAVLYIFNLATGAVIKKFDTNASGDNGLATPGVLDSDNDGDIDVIYAGDLQGNVWKFDVSGANNTAWNIALSGAPLFIAKDPTDIRQPITAPITAAINDVTADPNKGKVFLFFGTGSYFRNGDPADKQKQSWYGLIDDNAPISSRTELTARTIQEEGSVSGKPVRTFSTASPGDMSGKKGWYIDLVKPNGTAQGERMVTASQLYNLDEPTLIASSIIPITDDPCLPGGTGYVNAVNAYTGGRLSGGFFDLNNNGNFTDDKLNDNFVGSVDLGVGMPSKPIVVGNRLVVGGSSGRIEDIRIKVPVPKNKGRISWREIVTE